MFPLIWPEHKLILFHTPKCGCSSIKYFYLSAKQPDVNLVEANKQRICVDIEKYSQYPDFERTHIIHQMLHPHRIRNFGPYADYRKILFIRDPFQRIVSAFVSSTVLLDYANVNGLSDEQWVKQFWSTISKKPSAIPSNEILTFYRTKSFRGFINVLKSFNIYQADQHYAPQTITTCCPPLAVSQFDEIIDVRNLSARLTRLNEELGTNGKIDTVNKTEYQSDVNMADVNIVEHVALGLAVSPWEFFYDENLKQTVRNIYKDDFAYFAAAAASSR